jgi:hypothetical protein
MNLEHLVDLIMQLRLDEPKPLALWFVDRSAEFYHLLRTAGDELNYLVYPLRYYGIPLLTFRPKYANSMELKAGPSFCSQPGIWVEMSDGNHVRLQDESLA